MKAARGTSRQSAGDGDWLHLRRIPLKCWLGVHPAERRRKRPIRVNLSLMCDCRPAAATDRLEDALNYEEIEAEVAALVRGSRCHLIETLAERIAEACLRHPAVRRVRVVLEKPAALPLAESVAVEIERAVDARSRKRIPAATGRDR